MMVSGSQVVNNQTLSVAKQTHTLIYALLNCFNFACLTLCFGGTEITATCMCIVHVNTSKDLSYLPESH